MKEYMFSRWAASASVYTLGECISCCLVDRPLDPVRVAKVAGFGGLGDSLAMRTFHRTVDRRIPSPFVRMLTEQCLYAPVSNAAYLTAVKSWEWTAKDWWDIYSTDCTFWPAVSFLGYKYVCLERRYVYVSVATVVWNTWRSTIVE